MKNTTMKATNVTKEMIMAAIQETNALLAGTATESTVRAGFTHMNKKFSTQNKSLVKIETEIAALKVVSAETNEKVSQIIAAIQSGKVGTQVATIKNENKDQVNKQYNTTANEATPIGSVIRKGKRVNVFAKCECCGEYIDSAKVYAYCKQSLSAALKGKVACHKCQGGVKAGVTEFPAVAPESKEELFPVVGSPISNGSTTSAPNKEGTATKCECCGDAITNMNVVRYNNARKLPMYCQPCQSVKGTNAESLKKNTSPVADTPIKAPCDFCGKEIVYKTQEIYLNQVDHATQIGIPESHKHICGTCYRGGKHEEIISKADEEVKVTVEESKVSAEEQAEMDAAQQALEAINAQKVAMQAELDKQNEMIQKLMAKKEAKEAKAKEEAKVEVPTEEMFLFEENGCEFTYKVEDVKSTCTALGIAFRRNMAKAKKAECLVWLKDNYGCNQDVEDTAIEEKVEAPDSDMPESCVDGSAEIDDSIMQLALSMASGEFATSESSDGGFVPVGGVPSNTGELVPLDLSKSASDVEF